MKLRSAGEPPVPGRLLLSGGLNIAARIGHEVADYRRLDVNSFHTLLSREVEDRGFWSGNSGNPGPLLLALDFPLMGEPEHYEKSEFGPLQCPAQSGRKPIPIAPDVSSGASG